jgi:hypothetical protein
MVAKIRIRNNIAPLCGDPLFGHIRYIVKNKVGGTRFSIGTQTPKEYLNLKLFNNTRRAMENTNIMTKT